MMLHTFLTFLTFVGCGLVVLSLYLNWRMR